MTQYKRIAPEKEPARNFQFDEIDELDFSTAVICFTGDFSDPGMSRDKLRHACEYLGAGTVDTMTEQVTVLVVGSAGSANWVGRNYGRKIEYALGLREQQSGIKIIEEKTFLECLKKYEKNKQTVNPIGKKAQIPVQHKTSVTYSKTTPAVTSKTKQKQKKAQESEKMVYNTEDFTPEQVEEYNELQRFKKLPLILCIACRNEISVNAKVCPHCGQPIKQKIPAWKWFFYVPIMILGVLFICGGVYGITHGGDSIYSIFTIVLGSACVLLPSSKR